MACAAQLVASGRLTIAEHLLAAKHIEHLKLNRKVVRRRFDQFADDDDLDAQNPPVVKINKPATSNGG
jgi:hypothetical protein